MKRGIIFFGLFLLVLSIANAQEESCSFRLSAGSTKQLLEQVPSIDESLSKCPVPIGQASKLIGDGTTAIEIEMKDGSQKSIYAIVKNKKLVGAKLVGSVSSYVVDTDEASLDLLLSSSNKFGAFSTLYAAKKIQIRSGTFFGKIKMFFIKPVFGFVAKKNIIQLEVREEVIGPYPQKWACEFSQVNKKHVTCAAYKAGDQFCAQVLTSPNARAEICTDTLVVCSNPCESTPRQIIPKSCPFDNDRARGSQAPPLNYCEKAQSPQTATAKAVAPKGCADTYLPGHDMYASNKEKWDLYTSQSSGVCQSNSPVSGCKYSIQTGQRGSSISYYLCWY